MSTLNLEHIKHENSSTNNITVDSDGSVAVNRHTSDGTIIDLQKDGTSVGSIGTWSGTNYIGSGDTGIAFAFGNDDIRPFNPSSVAQRDGAISLGETGTRFKDLYLSGGVYLGGTTSVNLLDDYEEGTWTPDLGGLSSVTYSYREGSYRKVGSLVVAFWDLTVNASSGTFNAAINGLPFTVNPSMAGFSVIQHRSSTLFNAGAVGTGKLAGFAERGAAYLALQVDHQNNTGTGFGFANDPGFNGTGRSTGYIIYETT
jgi:hypothetical protein